MTVARVTQSALETLATPDDQSARVSQVALEVLVAPSTQKARVSQVALEVLVTPTTQKVGSPAARVSQAALEVLISRWASAVVSQAALEVLVTESLNPAPPPEPPPSPPYSSAPVRERTWWRDAHGFVGECAFYVDPNNAENGGDVTLVASRCSSLVSLLDAALQGALVSASGPYYVRNLLLYGASAFGATVSDQLAVAAATAQGEIVWLRLPTAKWSSAGANQVALPGSDPNLLDAIVYWLAHCCAPSGAPLVTYLGGIRRRLPEATTATSYTRTPDLSRQAL